jgi:hypothetical protein
VNNIRCSLLDTLGCRGRRRRRRRRRCSNTLKYIEYIIDIVSDTGVDGVVHIVVVVVMKYVEQRMNRGYDIISDSMVWFVFTYFSGYRPPKGEDGDKDRYVNHMPRVWILHYIRDMALCMCCLL